MNVFLLQHAYERDEAEDIKVIGIYATYEAANEAQGRAVALPGFRDHPDGFSIDRVEVGQDSWTSGFVTERWREDDSGVQANEAA